MLQTQHLLWRKYNYIDRKINGFVEIYNISKDRKSLYIVYEINYVNNKRKELKKYDKLNQTSKQCIK